MIWHPRTSPPNDAEKDARVAWEDPASQPCPWILVPCSKTTTDQPCKSILLFRFYSVTLPMVPMGMQISAVAWPL